jgi:hypothetical protein
MAAEHQREQGEREQRHREEADEEEGAHAELPEHVLHEREVRAPDHHHRQRGGERSAGSRHSRSLEYRAP